MDDIKDLSVDELREFAAKIRNRIIDVMSKNGGHLASNLGSVELTLGMHYVFNSPKDRFLFDVSHQTYTHKLLTDRDNALFDKIRQDGGLSGFSHPEESPHDHFFAGHAGTALSLGLGLAKARDLEGGDEHIIPVIGDATLTCGLSLEALNNMKRDLGKFVVILNDNAMSISKNVGGITSILSRLLSNPTTSKVSHELDMLISTIPLCGNLLAKKSQQFGASLKNLVSSAPFFQQFGLSYIGPIDGHDIKKVVAVLNSVKDLEMPTIIHFYTTKGHGVKAAEEDPIAFHGVKPFDPKTCKFHPNPSRKPTFPKLFGKQLIKMAERDETVTVVTPAMSLGSSLDPFFERFPKRSIDVGIAEGHAVTFSGGMAKYHNRKVICSIYATFLHRALDNLFHDVCLQRVPVVFAIDRAGLASGDGATHHGIYDISFLQTMPNMVICQPRNGQLLKELMESAFLWKRPTAIRYPNMATDEGVTALQYRGLGQGEELAQGKDLLIIALGTCCTLALELRELLLKKNISATVVDPIFVKPLDAELLSKLLLNHKRVVTIEEHSLKGGLATVFGQFLHEHQFTETELLSFGLPESFIEHGSYKELLKSIGMLPEQMAHKITTHFSLGASHDRCALHQ